MRRHLITFSIAALAISACSTDTTTTANNDTSAQAEQTGPGGGDMTPARVDVVEAASAAGNLDTFLQAAIQAGLAETLAQADQITIFAPINEAFTAVPNLDEIQQDKQRLAQLLKRHAVAKTYMSGEIPLGRTEVETLSGETLTIVNNDGQISVETPGGTSAMVVQADISGGNGVVHAINTVLVD